MKKILLILLSLFLITGCAAQKSEVLVSDQDAVRLSVDFSVDKDVIELLSSYHVELPEEDPLNQNAPNPLLEEYINVFEGAGFVVKSEEDSVAISIKIQKEYPGIKDFNEDLKALNEKKILTNTMLIEKSSGLTKTIYRASGTFGFMKDQDLNTLIEDLSKTDSPLDLSKLSAVMSVRLPGKLVFVEGGEASSGGVVIKTTAEKDVEFKIATLINHVLVFIVGGGIILFGLLACGLVVFSVISKKKKAEKQKKIYGE